MEKSLGICIGASTIKIVELLWDNGKYSKGKTSVINHECNPKSIFLDEIKKFNLQTYDYVCVTGRKFKEIVNLPKITEPEATEYALKYYLNGTSCKFNALISMGSESFIMYELDRSGTIHNVQTRNKCASGTGEFFLQQIKRMDIGIDEAIRLAEESQAYSVSGRCSVFCKTDCTHALNKGITIGSTAAGLGDMIADKALELLQFTKKEDILLAGGVTKNSYVVNKLREKIKNLVVFEDADILEAMGAALFAYEKKKKTADLILRHEEVSFATLPPLSEAQGRVTFKDHEKKTAAIGDECILGLDVGSTTTKAVLLRTRDDAIVASVYLRTNGDPVRASRLCYEQIDAQLKETTVSIIGLGVTGSGRKIAGLHALTDGIINEIIAHATAAAFFDKDVDTIIEIGGQDAKYTHLVNGVPCDYAMNEACSAGTGSFLEEAAGESLNVHFLDIQDIALQARSPANFNDQCAAFISSDVKNAAHENIQKEDIVAGLVYSICMNYVNRVKGSRKIGKKIFMQGGVCYNKAVPLAMASLLEKDIVVPPEPGLMGAFGVALEIKRRLKDGLYEKTQFSLKELAGRQVEYKKTFICQGTPENCDRGCTINTVRLNGGTHLFGGSCNKYYNLMHHLSIDAQPFDIVSARNVLVFGCHEEKQSQKTIGILKSFLTNTLYPLYYHFFSELGLGVILSDTVDKESKGKASSSFCFPAEISHGMFMDLIKKKPDYIFLPQVTELHVEKSQSYEPEHQCVCVLAQSEPYYLRSAFRDLNIPLIHAVLNFSRGWQTMEGEFVNVAKSLGVESARAKKAFAFALEKQKEFFKKRARLGEEVLKDLERDKSKIGIVLFGRPYNTFVDEANMGIPRKFSSRGFTVIPFDCLPYQDESSTENMNWAIGQEIIKASNFVKKHPQLFAAFVTNFSCGPDSFIVEYFRDIMKTKPSLTIELDSHTADAGINTRIEAFLDIVERYRILGITDPAPLPFKKAQLVKRNKKMVYISSENKTYSLKDRRVKILIPSMGRGVSELLAAAFKSFGLNAEAVPVPEFKTLMLGRSNTTCKECLPLILTTASLLDYIENRKNPEEMLLYFMPTTSGSCRFSQYYVSMQKMVEKKMLSNVAFLTLTSDNAYAGLGFVKSMRLLDTVIIADIMDDIRNALLVLAKNKDEALSAYDAQWAKLLACFTRGRGFYKTLREISGELAKIQLRYPLHHAKKVLLAGEIYTRRDEFSSQDIVQRMAKRDIITKRSPILEWLYYVDYIVINQLKPDMTFKEKTDFFLRQIAKRRIERKIKKTLAISGLYE